MTGTPEQLACLDALLEHHTGKAAARALFMSRRQFYRRLEELRILNHCGSTYALCRLRGQEMQRAA